MNLLTQFGARTTRFFMHWGRITALLGRVIQLTFKGKPHARRTIEQMVLLGTKSLPIVLITAMFVGMAFTVQVSREFIKFGARDMIGGVVGLAIWRELGPLLTGVVFSGRVGAAIAAELGTMKVSEQIEALETMSQDPVDFLIVPRVLACAIMLPMLVGLADIVGFLGGLFVAIGTGRINIYSYFDSAQTLLTTADIYGGLFKGFLFGIVVALISTYMGLTARSGAKGVGKVTTRAVVVSLISIFILNYILSLVLFQ